MGYHDVAQVCPNGHVANDSMRKHPEFNEAFCSRCGEATISACPKCGSEIQGEYYVPGVSAIGFTFHPPGFCHKCGNPFPWTERKRQAAIDLFGEEDVTEEDRATFERSVREITKDTPQAQVASKRILKVLKKVGAGTATAIRDILVDVASEAAKKVLLP
jgi:hypothetical protein